MLKLLHFARFRNPLHRASNFDLTWPVRRAGTHVRIHPHRRRHPRRAHPDRSQAVELPALLNPVHRAGHGEQIVDAVQMRVVS